MVGRICHFAKSQTTTLFGVYHDLLTPFPVASVPREVQPYAVHHKNSLLSGHCCICLQEPGGREEVGWRTTKSWNLFLFPLPGSAIFLSHSSCLLILLQDSHPKPSSYWKALSIKYNQRLLLVQIPQCSASSYQPAPYLLTDEDSYIQADFSKLVLRFELPTAAVPFFLKPFGKRECSSTYRCSCIHWIIEACIFKGRKKKQTQFMLLCTRANSNCMFSLKLSCKWTQQLNFPEIYFMWHCCKNYMKWCMLECFVGNNSYSIINNVLKKTILDFLEIDSICLDRKVNVEIMLLCYPELSEFSSQGSNDGVLRRVHKANFTFFFNLCCHYFP